MFFDELFFLFVLFFFLQLEKKASLQNKLAEVQQEHKRHIELVQSQHSKIVQDMQKDMAQQLAKLQEQLNKRESEKQQQLAQGRKKSLYDTMSQSIPNAFFVVAQGERKALQEKLCACAAELESERKELARVRQEEAELQAQHNQSIENFRSEISRLHSDLRSAGSVLIVQHFNRETVNYFIFDGDDSGKVDQKRCRRPNKSWP